MTKRNKIKYWFTRIIAVQADGESQSRMKKCPLHT